MVRFIPLTVAACYTFLSAVSAHAGGPLKGRVVDIFECRETKGVLKGHDLAVPRVYGGGDGVSTFVIYSTYPGHGLNRREFLQMAKDSMANKTNLDFYWSENKGSGVCGVTTPSRYHFLQDMR
ncbi:hypothetical protein [Dapis sp. BLCC M229]|uniref:hypothetical protein n=1 Tax=Dapis sp. BLCC M229 TaxID=3400188 RepID=UPI003CE7696E